MSCIHLYLPHNCNPLIPKASTETQILSLPILPLPFGHNKPQAAISLQASRSRYHSADFFLPFDIAPHSSSTRPTPHPRSTEPHPRHFLENPPVPPLPPIGSFPARLQKTSPHARSSPSRPHPSIPLPALPQSSTPHRRPPSSSNSMSFPFPRKQSCIAFRWTYLPCRHPFTNIPEYQGQEKIVIRRYSDFVWLRNRLADKFKGIFIPPLPEKSAVEKFRFSAEFIELRRQALDVFINRVASHPELRRSEDLRIFLQEDEETMERARSQENGIFKKKPSEFMQIFKDVQSKVSDVVLGKEKPVEETSPEYEKLKHYIFELEDHLSEAQKQAFRLVKRHRELGQSLSDFGKAIKLLGVCEGETLGKAFSELGSKLELMSLKLHKEAQNLLMNFEEPLKDYVRAVQSIKVTMMDRANAFKQHYELAETIRLKEINLDKLTLIRSDRAGEAEIEFRELRAESEEATARYETIAKLMNEEFLRFQEQKTAELGLVFHEFAKGQAKLSNEIADAWRSLLPKLAVSS